MFNKLNHYDFLVNPVCSLQSFLRIWGRYRGKLFYIGGSHARYASQAIFGLGTTYIEHLLRRVSRSLLRNSHLVLSALFVLSTTQFSHTLVGPHLHAFWPLGGAGQLTVVTWPLPLAAAILPAALQLARRKEAISPAAFYDMFVQKPFSGHQATIAERCRECGSFQRQQPGRTRVTFFFFLSCAPSACSLWCPFSSLSIKQPST